MRLTAKEATCLRTPVAGEQAAHCATAALPAQQESPGMLTCIR